MAENSTKCFSFCPPPLFQTLSEIFHFLTLTPRLEPNCFAASAQNLCLFIFESRSENESCSFMSTKTRNDCSKILRNQERPLRLLEGHSGDSCKVPLLMHIETWNSVYGFSNVYLEHSLCQRTYSTPVRNHRRPLRLLGGRFGDTLEKYHL